MNEMPKETLQQALKLLVTSKYVSKKTGYSSTHMSTYIERKKVPEPLGKCGERFYVWDKRDVDLWQEEEE